MAVKKKSIKRKSDLKKQAKKPKKAIKKKKAALKKKSTSHKKVAKAVKKTVKSFTKGLRSYRVVCQEDGTIGRGLTLAQARALRDSHREQTSHSVTYTSSQ